MTPALCFALFLPLYALFRVLCVLGNGNHQKVTQRLVRELAEGYRGSPEAEATALQALGGGLMVNTGG